MRYDPRIPQRREIDPGFEADRMRREKLARILEERMGQPIDPAAFQPAFQPQAAAAPAAATPGAAPTAGLAGLFSGGDAPVPASKPVQSPTPFFGEGDGTAVSAARSAPAGELAPHQRALLDTIASTESPDYNVIYGGSRFDDYSDHPRRAIPIRSGPNRGKTSSAAGRYQFLGSTWDELAKKHGFSDFSPANQDRAAIAYAQDVYRDKTGGDLDAALRSGDPAKIAQVGRALSGAWTSLPGGIEQGQGTNRFVSSYTDALGSPSYPQVQNMGVRPEPQIQGDPTSEQVVAALAASRANAARFDPARPSTGDPELPLTPNARIAQGFDVAAPSVPTGVQPIPAPNDNLPSEGDADPEEYGMPAPAVVPSVPAPQNPVVQAMQARRLSPAQTAVYQPEERDSALAGDLRPVPAGFGGGIPAQGGAQPSQGRGAIARLLAGRQNAGNNGNAVTGGGVDYYGAGPSRARGLIPKLLDRNRMRQEGTRLMEAILARPGNTYTAEQLAGQPIDVLQQIAIAPGPSYDDALKTRKLEAEVSNLENPGTFTDLTDEDEARIGLDPTGTYQRGADGKLYKVGGNGVNVTTNVGGENSKGWQKIDENFHPQYFEWQGGGFANVIKQVSQLKDALKILESGEQVTGAGIGSLPDIIQPFVNPNGVIAKDRVAEVVQNSLKAILGAQFTEKEGQKLIERTYNDRVEPAENARRVRALMQQITAMGEAKQNMVNHFEQHGTLQGYKGKQPTLSEIQNWDYGQPEASQSGPVPEGIDPNVWKHMTPEDRALWK